MKILLRNTETSLYATGNGLWMKDRGRAHNFFFSQVAYQHAMAHRLANTEVVFAFDDIQYDFSLPPISSLVSRPRVQ